MHTLNELVARQERDLMSRQFATPWSRYQAAAMAAQEPWRHRFARRARRLKLLARQSSAACAVRESR